MKKPKAPVYRDGELVCPHCGTPLLTEETADGRFRCVFCGGEVSRLTEETMKKMIDDFPKRLIKEWLVESA